MGSAGPGDAASVAGGAPGVADADAAAADADDAQVSDLEVGRLGVRLHPAAHGLGVGGVAGEPVERLGRQRDQ